MSRRLLVAVLVAVVTAGLLLVGLEALHELFVGSWHPPTDGGYWGGIFLHALDDLSL